MELNPLQLRNFSAWRHSRFTRQALLLLGGAFVFVVFLLLRPYALVVDTGPTAPPESEIIFSFLRRDTAFLTSEPWQKFLASLPKEAVSALEQAPAGQTATLFAVRGEDDSLHWGLVEMLSASQKRGGKSVKKFVPREVGAIGSFKIEGKIESFQAFFETDSVRFEVGRGYRGLAKRSAPFAAGRRLLVPIIQQSAYLEKPAQATWGEIPAFFQANMQRYQELASPWTWPGRVELAVSASSTKETLSPFLLFYQPVVGQKNVAKQTEYFARNLLAQVSPQTILVNLPDDTQMKEFRHDSESIQKEEIRNQFGTLLRFTSPGKSQKMLVFQANNGEVWISNDLALIQAGFLENIHAEKADTACDRPNNGGFASFSGKNLSYGLFSKVQISIVSFETGLFTLCGYY